MSKTILELLTYENIVLRHYIFWISILLIKMLLMSILTGAQRFRTKSYANPEDVRQFGIEIKINENVERVRRAHLNDMENILPFTMIGLFYILTDPTPTLAITLFCVATLARIWHTIVYAIYVIPQPARILGFSIPLIITIYMAVQSAIVFIIF